MDDRTRATSKRGAAKNGNGAPTATRPANRLGVVPAAAARRKAAAKRTTAARHDVEETFTRGFWAAWGRPVAEAAALCFVLLGAIALLRPREPAAALDLGGSSSYELGFSPEARRLAPDVPAPALIGTGGSTAAGPSQGPPAEEQEGAEAAGHPAGGPGAQPSTVASARTSSPSPRSSGSSRPAVTRTSSFDRKGGAEPGKKRRTSVKVEKRVEKAEGVTRPPIIQKPRVRYAPRPAYPAGAKADETEGFVRFSVQVSPTGAVGDIEILEADPPGVFDEAVKAAVRLWQFAPARDETGKGIESTHENTIAFEVEQAAS